MRDGKRLRVELAAAASSLKKLGGQSAAGDFLEDKLQERNEECAELRAHTATDASDASMWRRLLSRLPLRGSTNTRGAPRAY